MDDFCDLFGVFRVLFHVDESWFIVVFFRTVIMRLWMKSDPQRVTFLVVFIVTFWGMHGGFSGIIHWF